jgi:hypothetical protein
MGLQDLDSIIFFLFFSFCPRIVAGSVTRDRILLLMAEDGGVVGIFLCQPECYVICKPGQCWMA